jgi:transcriptional regulator GlxA family with amidase domain
MASSWEPIRASCGTHVYPLEVFDNPRQFDYVAFCGGLRSAESSANRKTLSFMRCVADAGVCLIGVCTGAFELARAGLMAGRRCAVSWHHRRELVAEFPGVTPVTDQLFVVDRDRVTCAGGIGAGDLAVWLLRKHSGISVAQKSLHLLQMDKGRLPESPQPQPPGWPSTSNIYVRKALLLMEANLSEPTSVGDLATKLNISVRHMERCFISHIGTSPRKTLILMRLRHARYLLGKSHQNVTAIAHEVGFADLAHFSRSFLKEFGIRPSKCREPIWQIQIQGRIY